MIQIAQQIVQVFSIVYALVVGGNNCECPNYTSRHQAIVHCKAVKEHAGREAFRACMERVEYCAGRNHDGR